MSTETVIPAFAQLPGQSSGKTLEVYNPTDEEKDLLLKIYQNVENDLLLKNQSYELLNNRTLTQFWDDCNKDYNLYIPPARSDEWVKMYRRPITRDKANTFIAQLTKGLIYPEIIAQNKEQQVDREISQVCRYLLEYKEQNDGAPFESGESKFVSIVHKAVIEGTVHVQEGKDENGNLTKRIIPNEEVLIPNYWQPNLEKQAHLILYQNKISYDEAEIELGHLNNWKYVKKGSANNWVISENTQFYKAMSSGLMAENEVHIVRIWWPVPKNKLTKGRKKEKYYNLVVNGVLMYDPENKDEYKHGCYCVAKGGFEMFSTDFYWMNSLPNKGRNDQAIYDTFYTLMVNGEKLNKFPPLLTRNGLYLNQSIIEPRKITSIQGDPSKDVSVIPGLNTSNVPIINAMGLVERSLDNSTAAPQAAGQVGTQAKTATEAAYLQAAAQDMLGIFGRMIGFLIQSLGYLAVRNCLQFYPAQFDKVKGIAQINVPNQTLSDGKMGTVEILFQKPEPMTPKALKAKKRELLAGEEDSLKQGYAKETKIVNPEYLENLDLYLYVSAATINKPSDALAKAQAMELFQLLNGNPLVNQPELVRDLLRGFKSNEERLVQNVQPPIPQEGGAPTGISSMKQLTPKLQTV